MNTVLQYICVPLGYLMKWCWQLIPNYGLAIILFTLATKVILLPLSIWIQKNSIAMVKIQPAVNFLKVNHYGDGDTIAEEQTKLFKKEHYHPMLSLVPLALQIFLLLGVVEIIYHPLTFLFATDRGVITSLANFIGADLSGSSYQLAIIDAIQDGRISAGMSIDGVSADALSAICSAAGRLDLSFLGLNISKIPGEVLGWYLVVPVIAGVSSWVLCFTQNLSNVIQHEQGKLSKYGLMVVSVGISLYLGFFVPAGIAIYWVASNLFSVLQMYILNACINPKKYVDYAALEESRRQLAAIAALDKTDKGSAAYKEARRRERTDYKRFFGIVGKHVVFYSEKSGFYKYFEGLIKELLSRSNLTVHYVTNDPDDVIFTVAKDNPRIQPYYIGLRKTIPLMMRMEADIVVMTTPDLDKYYIKRSFMKKDIEYIYVPHDMMSIQASFREGAFDAFDTIFATGGHIKDEIRATERVYGLREKRVVEFGYPLADRLRELGHEANEKRAKRAPGAPREILVAPSWNEDNLIDSCMEGLVSSFCKEGYHLTVRPHPEYVKRFAARMRAVQDRFADIPEKYLTFELDFSKNSSIYTSDLLITDWSGVGPEFAFATGRPVLFVDTKFKCLNPNYEKIGLVPVEVSLRSEIGMAISKEDVAHADEYARRLFDNAAEYEKRISDVFSAFVYNHGHAAEAGAKYILSSLIEKRKKK